MIWACALILLGVLHAGTAEFRWRMFLSLNDGILSSKDGREDLRQSDKQRGQQT